MKKVILFLIVFMTSLTLVLQESHAMSSNEDISEYADKKIVFLGDSIIKGYGIVEDSDRFGEIVSETLQFDDYVNMGVSGATIAQIVGSEYSLLDRAPSVPADSDYVVILGGLNDYANDVPLVDFTADVSAMLTAVKNAAPDATIILMTPYEVMYDDDPSSVVNAEGLALQDYVDVLIAATDETGDENPVISLIDLYSMLGFDATNVDDRAQFTTDGRHPNIAGNIWIANILISFFSGENLMVGSTINSGYFEDDGTYKYSADYSYTSLIPVEAGKSYVFYNESTTAKPLLYPGLYHDENGDYVSSIPNDILHRYEVVTIPEGVSYIRLNLLNDGLTNEISFLREIENYESFTVTFDTDGGTLILSQVIETGYVVDKPEDPIKVGNTFVTWYEDEDFSTLYDFDSLVTSDMTLYAKWALTTVTNGGTVVFDTSGDTVEVFGIDWYWIAAAAGAAYLVFGTKKGRKAVGLK